MTTKRDDLKRKIVCTSEDSDDDSHAVPNTDDDEILLMDLGNHSSESSKKQKKKDVVKLSDKPSHDKKKSKKKKAPPPADSPTAAKQIPADASTKRTTRSKSAPFNRPINTPTPSLDTGNDGYGVLVHKPEIHSSPAPALAQSADSNAANTNANVVDVGNGTPINVMEHSPRSANVRPLAAAASTDINHENDVADLDQNDHHVAAESQESADFIQFKEAAPVNVTTLDVFAEENLVMAGITHVVGSAHPSDFDATTADKSNDSINGLPRTEETAFKNVIESPRREIVGSDNVVDLTMSQVANMPDTDSSNSEEVEIECTTLVKVDGYIVRQDLEATAHFILKKYGNIVADTSHSLSFRSWIFANICETYRKLEKSTLAMLSLPKLKQMQNDVGIAAQENFDVSWLVNMLEEICDAKESLQQFSCLEDETRLGDGVISELERELVMQKDLLQKTHQKVKDIEEKLKTEMGKVEACEMAQIEVYKKVQKFHNKPSLVDI